MRNILTSNISFLMILLIIIGAAVYFTIVQLKSWNDESTYSINKYKNLDIEKIRTQVLRMDGREFEFFVAKIFQIMGYRTEVTQATNDEGRDIIIFGYKGHKETYIECKRYNKNNTVGSEIINKLVGSCVVHGVRSAIVVTTSSYTKAALTIRDKMNWVEFWYLDDLLYELKNCNSRDLMQLNGIISI